MFYPNFYCADTNSVLFKLILSSLCVCNGNLDFNTRLNADAGDLLDNLRRAVKVNEAFVDPHLKPIPGLRTLSTRSLTGGDAQSLKGKKKREKAWITAWTWHSNSWLNHWKKKKKKS